MVISFAILEREQKDQIADATTRLIRESFLITDFRSVTRDIERVKSNNFTKIIALNSKNNILAQSSADEGYINLKIKKSIGTDRFSKNVKGHVLFYFSLDHLFLLTFKILLGSTLITMPLSLISLRYLKKKQWEKIENEKNFMLVNFTKQLSHDIRSPIAALHNLANTDKTLTIDEMIIFKKSLTRIDKIANTYLDLSRNVSIKAYDIYSLNLIIEEILIEKKIEFPDLSIILDLKECNIYCNPDGLKRILSNLINNSYESMLNREKIISISIIENASIITLQISDKGKGIPSHVISKIGKESFSTKIKGNGVGLLHAVQELKEWNSTLKISQTSRSGTSIEIYFPQIKNCTYLIDDDELVRLTWESKAFKNNVNLKTFKSYQDFLSIKNDLSKDSIIYVDSELEDEIKGEEVATLLNNEGFTNISITSGHPKEIFQNLTFLKKIISKTPPF